jgi:ABC-type branched-subunit amino acid transport system permease subunit
METRIVVGLVLAILAALGCRVMLRNWQRDDISPVRRVLSYMAFSWPLALLLHVVGMISIGGATSVAIGTAFGALIARPDRQR